MLALNKPSRAEVSPKLLHQGSVPWNISMVYTSHLRCLLGQVNNNSSNNSQSALSIFSVAGDAVRILYKITRDPHMVHHVEWAVLLPFHR